MNINKMKYIKELVPPIFIRILNNVYGWKFNYTTWGEAKRKATGYDSSTIVEKVKEAIIKVNNGTAKYEKDSVLFYKDEFSYPVLTCLLWIASKNKNSLNMIDFGGSLGSTYYRNKRFLEHLSPLHWNIVEQKIFSDCGVKHFSNEIVRFYNDLDECLRNNNSNVILLSSVIQYIEHPYDLLHKIINKRFEYILFDRTPFIEGYKDNITLQKVPPYIYHASYPCWILGEQKFIEMMSHKYEIICDFDSLDDGNFKNVRFKGFFFKRRDV
jgi:putative methyltransferase (TIGR04325 family)